MVDYNRLNLNNIYKQWIQNQIETANAKGLLGNDTAQSIINKDLVEPIDNILKQAKDNLSRNIKLGTVPGGYQQMLKDTAPKSNMFMNQQIIDDYVNKITKDFTNGKNIKMPSTTNSAMRSGYKQMLIDTAPKADKIDDIAELMTKELLGVKDIGKKTFVKKAGTTALKSGAMAAAGNSVKQALGKAVVAGKGNPYLTGGIALATILGPMAYDWFKNRNNTIEEENENPKQTKDINGQGNGNKNQTNSNEPVSTKQQAQEIVNEINSLQPEQSNGDISSKLTPEEEMLNQYIEMLQKYRQPYIDALNSYMDNYNTGLDDYRRARKFYTGLAGWSGNSRFADLAQDYNPFTIEANRLALAKQIYDANIDNMNTMNELKGNMALAKEMELPPEAAFANKNLLTALSQAKRYATDLEKAHINDAMRRYGYDVGYRRAIDAQNLRNQGIANQAMIYVGGVQPGIGLNANGTVQQQTYSPVNQRQSAEQNYYKQILGH